jgi:hypothetical protein
MTLDNVDESYADRPATTMRVPLPTHVQFSERRSDGVASEETVHLVRSNEALKARFVLPSCFLLYFCLMACFLYA